jgi:hygromycin-B 7''-O-kinase
MLPEVETWDAMPGEAALRPGVERLCGELGVDPAGLVRYGSGSRPVYAAGDLVLKLFPPLDGDAYRVEASVLAAVSGALPAATPAVHAVGEHGTGEGRGWGYVLMSRLPGVPLDTVWPELTEADRDRIADRLGQTLAALHNVEPPERLPEGWRAFVTRQRASCEREQRELGLAHEWAAQIPGFLDSTPLRDTPLRDTPQALLHTEIMREHLLVSQDRGGAWQLSGLIDFEPAMRGAPEYEFAALGVFAAAGDARFLRRALLAYGYSDGELDTGLRRRLMGWTILHRYSHLSAYLARLPPPSTATFEAAADRWFAT